MLKKITLVIWAGLFLARFSLASATPAAGPGPRQVTLEFTVSARESIGGLVYRPGNDKAFHPVVFYGAYRADSLRYKGAETLEFYSATTAGAENAKPVARCVIPEGMSKAFLLFFPKQTPAADGLSYDVVAIDDAMEKIGPGSFAVINLTNQEYAAHYGAASPIVIGRGVSPSYQASGEVMLRLAMQKADGWRKAGRRGFDLGERNRVWVIIYPPAAPTDVYPIIRTLTQEMPALSPRSPGTVVAKYP